jgi:hypothetical protein
MAAGGARGWNLPRATRRPEEPTAGENRAFMGRAGISFLLVVCFFLAGCCREASDVASPHRVDQLRPLPSPIPLLLLFFYHAVVGLYEATV